MLQRPPTIAKDNMPQHSVAFPARKIDSPAGHFGPDVLAHRVAQPAGFSARLFFLLVLVAGLCYFISPVAASVVEWVGQCSTGTTEGGPASRVWHGMAYLGFALLAVACCLSYYAFALRLVEVLLLVHRGRRSDRSRSLSKWMGAFSLWYVANTGRQRGAARDAARGALVGVLSYYAFRAILLCARITVAFWIVALPIVVVSKTAALAFCSGEQVLTLPSTLRNQDKGLG